MNEEVMWQRVKDLQREAENRRLVGPRPSLIGVLSSLVLSLGRTLTPAPSRLVRSEPWPQDDPSEATDAA
jgi:hypothetical protein